MNSAHAYYHDRETLKLSTPYEPGFIAALKQAVPAPYRTWEPETKTWVVRFPYDTAAMEILTFFPTATVGDRPKAKRGHARPSGCSCDSDHRALFVCQNAPPEVLQAAYRALAKLNHPDAGGDHARMQAINTAYEHLAGRVSR